MIVYEEQEFYRIIDGCIYMPFDIKQGDISCTTYC